MKEEDVNEKKGRRQGKCCSVYAVLAVLVVLAGRTWAAAPKIEMVLVKSRFIRSALMNLHREVCGYTRAVAGGDGK